MDVLLRVIDFVLTKLSQVSGYLMAHIGVNLLDVVVVAVILFYAHEGYTLGFTLAFLDLASFVLSFIGALKFYGLVAHFFITYLSMPIGFANAVGFFVVAFVSEIILSILFRKLFSLLPHSKLHTHSAIYRWYQTADHFLGFIPGIISSFIVLSFLLTVIVSLPSSPFIKHLVTGSRMGSVLVSNTSMFEDKLNTIFGGALTDTLNFLTVEPQSNESLSLHFRVTNGTADDAAELQMFQMVNQERIKAGLKPLVWDTHLRDLGRSHSQDMFARGYFSHYTPEGESPFDRMTNANISFSYAGENLALAPSTELAMQGLMNSPGHRANILNPNFGTIGIGAIDGGVYGIMFSQEFTN
jgi:uncharacterized protein YkwD